MQWPARDGRPCAWLCLKAAYAATQTSRQALPFARCSAWLSWPGGAAGHCDSGASWPLAGTSPEKSSHGQSHPHP